MLWHGGAITAVLDWDRCRVQPVAAELIRACLLMFDGDDCDHLFVRNERMLRWWTAHRAEVTAAFVG